MGGIILVNDRMQSGYCYCRTERMGANFHPESEPELTPKEMLQLGVFCGKYMTDTRREFPEDWLMIVGKSERIERGRSTPPIGTGSGDRRSIHRPRLRNEGTK
jgi:hypothetical protein